MQAAASGGYGSYSGGSSGGDCFTIDICPDLLLAAIAAASAGAFYLIYINITKSSAKRKKRTLIRDNFDILDYMNDLVTIGNVIYSMLGCNCTYLFEIT